MRLTSKKSYLQKLVRRNPIEYSMYWNKWRWNICGMHRQQSPSYSNYLPASVWQCQYFHAETMHMHTLVHYTISIHAIAGDNKSMRNGFGCINVTCTNQAVTSFLGAVHLLLLCSFRSSFLMSKWVAYIPLLLCVHTWRYDTRTPKKHSFSSYSTLALNNFINVAGL